MKAENKQHLSETLYYAGFGDVHPKDLEKAFQTEARRVDYDITLKYKSKGIEKDVPFTLIFGRSKDDNWYLNAFTLNSKDHPLQFYNNRDEKMFTSKEAFNLSEGRAVYKERSTIEKNKYNDWLQVDFENTTPEKIKFNIFNENYGYNPKIALAKINSMGLYFPTTADNIIASMKKGNDVEAFNLDKSKRFYVEAEPRFKSTNLYDHKGEPIDLRTFNMEGPKEGQSNSMKM